MIITVLSEIVSYPYRASRSRTKLQDVENQPGVHDDRGLLLSIFE